MKRTILSVILVIALVCCLTACGCKHEWQDATCTAPKTCKLCDATEGEVTDHTLAEANYQIGEHCVDCGEVFGDPIVSEFERTGRAYQTIDLTTAHGNVYEYTTGQYNDTQATTGEVLVSWAIPMDPTADSEATAINCYVPEGILPEVIAMDGIQESFENLDGYVWQGIQAVVKFPGQRNMIWGYEDYYDLTQYDENAVMETFKDGNTDGMVIASMFSVNMNGKSYDQCMMISIVLDVKTEVGIATFYRVPENYDGCVFSLIDSRVLANSNATSEDAGNGFTSYTDVAHGAGDIYFRLH